MELDSISDFYRDAILDHCRNPHNHDIIDAPDATGRSVNPFCGDEVDVQVLMDRDRLADIGVQAIGCTINQASASIMAEVVKGKTTQEARLIGGQFRKIMTGEVENREIDYPGNLSSLFGVREFPVRIKCALLPWTALEDTLD